MQQTPSLGYDSDHVAGDNSGSAIGVSVAVGRLLRANLSFEVEVVVPTAVSGPASTDLHVSGWIDYHASERAVLASMAVRRRITLRHNATLEPLAGLALVTAHQAQTQAVHYPWNEPSVGNTEPDEDRWLIRPGVVLGCDYVARLPPRVSVVAGARLHVLRSEQVDSDFFFPPQGGLTVRGNVGVRWDVGRGH